MCNRFTTFSEIPAGISGRKACCLKFQFEPTRSAQRNRFAKGKSTSSCNETIICSGRLRCAPLPTQKSFLGAAKLPLRIEIEGAAPLQATLGLLALVQQPPDFFALVCAKIRSKRARFSACCPILGTILHDSSEKFHKNAIALGGGLYYNAS